MYGVYEPLCKRHKLNNNNKNGNKNKNQKQQQALRYTKRCVAFIDRDIHTNYSNFNDYSNAFKMDIDWKIQA